MASVGEARRRVVGFGNSTAGQRRNPVIEEIKPFHDWTEDSNGHYLLVDLPAFKREQVKVQVFNSGTIKVSGERPIDVNKRIRFEQTFKAPENTDTDTISAKFDGDLQILHITVPKRKAEEKRKPQPEPEPEPEPVGLKDQQNANGATQEENVKQMPHGDEMKNKNSNACDDHQEFEAKEEEEDQRNEPASFSEENVRGQDREPSHRYLRTAIEILAKNKRIVVAAVLAFSLGVLMSRKFESNED